MLSDLGNIRYLQRWWTCTQKRPWERAWKRRRRRVAEKKECSKFFHAGLGRFIHWRSTLIFLEGDPDAQITTSEGGFSLFLTQAYFGDCFSSAFCLCSTVNIYFFVLISAWFSSTRPSLQAYQHTDLHNTLHITSARSSSLSLHNSIQQTIRESIWRSIVTRYTATPHIWWIDPTLDKYFHLPDAF